MSEEYSFRKNKNIFNHCFTFPILAKLQAGFRPSQIAGSLGTSPQVIHYHIEKMIEADLIYKDTSNGIKWKLTEKGTFILKQKATGSVNSFTNYQIKPAARPIPVRLDNLSFKFKIQSPIPLDEHLQWSEMRNGVSKCSLKYHDHTVELVKSQKEGNGSSIVIHLKSKYCFNSTLELIGQYNLARHFAKQAAIKFRFEISEFGYPSKIPHHAFEQDLIAPYLAASCTAEVKTREGEDEYRAWIDSSNGDGELETNDVEYEFNYLMMPKYVKEILYNSVKTIRRINTEYERHYHPYWTDNN
jgi:predicted transcriptional regulator